MSYWVNNVIKELLLKIPKKDFPLKSDLILGSKRPFMLYPCDEGSTDELHPEITDNEVIFDVPGDDESSSIVFHENYNEAIDELVELCKKYKGTLICESTGEEGETEYTRIRDGKEKKVKVIEED